MALEPKLIKLPMVKRAEFGRQATEGPDKPELPDDDVNDEAKTSLLGKLQAILGFTLDLNERIPCRQKIGVQVVATVRGISKVPNFFAPSKARRMRSRPAWTCLFHGMT
jgi:hypothetical protein